MTGDELLARQAERESNARTYPRNLPLAIERALGVEVWDVDGRRYLDFFAGAGTLALGHGHPRVVAAVEEQLPKLVHALDLPTPVRDAFVGELLATLPPGLRGTMKVHLCAPTGSDAVEAAIKLCKRATGRTAILAFAGAYHGTSAGALAASGNVELKTRLGGLPEAHFAPFAYCARCPLQLDARTCRTACAAMTESMLDDPCSGVPRPALAIVEPVQGEGGSVVPTREFMRRVRAATARAGVPLVVDEIQCGLGRTGRWWAFEHFDIVPDVILTSKALGGIGLPVAAILYRAELDGWEPGTHIGTFRGHQLAFAAGAAALRVMREDDVLANVRARGDELVAGLRALRCPAIAEVRGLGLLLGVEFAHPDTRAPLPELASAVRAACFARGMLVELGGRHQATLRLVPPLVITREHVAEALAIIEAAVDHAWREVQAA